MNKNLYKYIGPSSLEKIISADDFFKLKCSCPKDFNDPYELFLTVNFEQDPEVLAFYVDVIGDLPQLPTICFSRSPAVLPMWAHYAQNLEGVVIEFNELMLREHFHESRFGDINYTDTTNEGLEEILHRAFALSKPRYFHMLNQGVFSAAYFTKAMCWTYEKERRMVVTKEDAKHVNEMTLIDIPKECVKSLICGPRTSNAIRNMVRDKANILACNYFELKIGKTSAVPFFVDSNGRSFSFNETDIEQCIYSCKTCQEPLTIASKLCSWCQIDDSHKDKAMLHNTYRMLDRHGLLDSYVQKMFDIDKSSSTHRKR